MWREVMRPSLLRPPDFVLPSTSILTGLPFHSIDLSTWIRWRRPGDVGLYVLSAVMRTLSEPCRHVDRLPAFERHDGPLRIAQHGGDAAERLLLALADNRVHGFDLDLEQAFDRGLDLCLRRLPV